MEINISLINNRWLVISDSYYDIFKITLLSQIYQLPSSSYSMCIFFSVLVDGHRVDVKRNIPNISTFWSSKPDLARIEVEKQCLLKHRQTIINFIENMEQHKHDFKTTNS